LNLQGLGSCIKDAQARIAGIKGGRGRVRKKRRWENKKDRGLRKEGREHLL